MLKSIKHKNICIAVLAPIIVVLYSVMFLFLNNIDESGIKDLITPLWISFVVIIVSMLVISFLTKNTYKGAILSSILYIIFLNYRYFEKIIQMISYKIRYWHLAPIVVLLFCVIAYLIYRYMSIELAKLTCSIIAIVFTALTILNIVTNFGGVIRKITKGNGNIVDIAETDVVLGQPNVYFIILDEYSNFNILEKYYGEDNKEFYDFLIDRGFTVSEHSQNEKINQLTLSFTTNYLNLNYVAFDSKPASEVYEYRVNPLLFQEFNNNGYSVNFHSPGIKIEWSGTYGNNGSSVNNTTTIDGKNFKQVFFNNNIFYPFTSKKDDTYDRQAWYDAYDFLVNEISESNQSRFTYVHTVGAHEPFVFTENGESVPPSERENLIDPQYYLGQYKFVTNQMMDALDTIISKDPESIIILMSDHSMRNTKDADGKFIVSAEDKVTILNAVYFRGETVDEINNQSGVNSLRIVLSKLFNKQFDIVEVPEG